MRILYVASNSDDSESLSLEKEITEMQRRLTRNKALPRVEIRFLPSLDIEELASEISHFSPTILHISAHAGSKRISFKNAQGKYVLVTARILAALIDVAKPPTLVYLNACDSMNIAKELSSLVSAAIGTTAPITNHDAIVSAARFYEALLEGATVGAAFRNAQALLRAVSNGQTSARLFGQGRDIQNIRLIEPFQIIARFGEDSDPDFDPDKDGNYDIVCGVMGCPADTTVVSFFSDDESFVEDDDNDLMIGLIKGPPIRGKMWEGTLFAYQGDFRIGAAGITGEGKAFAAYSTVCDALELFFARGGYGRGALSNTQKSKFRSAIAMLRRYDGS